MIFIKEHWPLIISVIVFMMTIAAFSIFCIRQNEGHIVYALDDAYINMAMAKNFAQNGNWGITKQGFDSASSSIIWVLLLSLIYFLFGPNEISPFILNVTFGTLTVVLAYILLRKYKLQPLYIAIALLAIIFYTSLSSLVFVGMEHTLQIFIAISFVYLAAKIISERKPTRLALSLLFILTPFVTMVRYEGIFLVLAVCTLLILRKKLLYSLCLGAIAVFPLLIYGVISTSNGSYFLPNPVILKGNLAKFSSLKGIIYSLGYIGYKNMVKTPQVLLFIAIALVVFIFQYNKQKTVWKDTNVMIVIFVAATFLHMQFASVDHFFRYEAYILALGMFVIFAAVHESLREEPSFKMLNVDKGMIPKYIAIILLVLLAISIPAERASLSLIYLPRATKNTYEQQYQMGLFLKKYYQDKGVAANDVGAINYLAEIKCFDIWGLTNFEIAKLKQEGLYNSRRIYNLAKQRDVKIAIVYDHWYTKHGGVPSQWTKVGEWKILNNVVNGGDVVSFYAVDPSEKDNLLDNLRAFSSQLPKGVIQIGIN